MHPPLSKTQIDMHNSLYHCAFALIKGEIFLDYVTDPNVPGFFTKRKLRKAIKTFQKVISINPRNWNAMFAIAKVHQRLGDMQASFEWLLKAREFAPDNPSLAKETALTAAHLGTYDKSIEVSIEAISVKPDDPVLHSNLGMSFLLANRPDEAVNSFKEALRLEPRHPATTRLLSYAKYVQAGHFPVPKSEREIIQNLPRTA